MNYDELGTDMTNPEHREIECSAYIGEEGKFVLAGAQSTDETITSDMVMDLTDAAELTDEAYSRTLAGTL